MTERRSTGGEVRALAGTRVSGTAMAYGSLGTAPGGVPERFLAGAFSPVPATIPLNLQHDRGSTIGEVELRDSATALRVEGDVTRAAHDLIRRGALTGFSVEFSGAEQRIVSATREIEKAVLSGLAVVDKPAYPAAGVEARQRRNSYSTTIRRARILGCKCLGTLGTRNVGQISFGEESFNRVIREVNAGDRIVSAISGSASDVVATTAAGLTLTQTRAGLGIRIEPLDTEAGRRFRELVTTEGVDVYARPLLDRDLSDFDVTGETAIITTAIFDNILVKPTPTNMGQTPLRRGPRGRAIPWARRKYLLA